MPYSPCRPTLKSEVCWTCEKQFFALLVMLSIKSLSVTFSSVVSRWTRLLELFLILLAHTSLPRISPYQFFFAQKTWCRAESKNKKVIVRSEEISSQACKHSRQQRSVYLISVYVMTKMKKKVIEKNCELLKPSAGLPRLRWSASRQFKKKRGDTHKILEESILCICLTAADCCERT